MKSVNSLIPENVLRKISRLRQLEAAIRAVLPDTAANRVKLLRLEDGVCVLSSPDQVWTANLRFYEPQIRSIIAEKTGISGIKVKVVNEVRRDFRVNSEDSLETTNKNAEINPDRKRLREVLKKL